MHKRVGLKKEAYWVSNQTIKPLTKGSISSKVLPPDQMSDFKKYKPLISALPQTMGSPPTIAERIRAAKKMTRRDLTEQRIIRNIYLHNNPQDVNNFGVLYVSNKQKSSFEQQLANEDSKDMLWKQKSRNSQLVQLNTEKLPNLNIC